MKFVEYIWLEGSGSDRIVRSRSRLLPLIDANPRLEDFPVWSLASASVVQLPDDAQGALLLPVCHARDPLRDGDHHLVLCEVFGSDGREHASNTRAELRAVLDAGARRQQVWMAFDQPCSLRWIDDESNSAGALQGCDPVGPRGLSAHDVAELHARQCLQAGLSFCGIEAAAEPWQWQFSIGPRNHRRDEPPMIQAADQLWLARHLLQRIAADAGAIVHFGSWQGRSRGSIHGSLRTRFSTAATRGQGGPRAVAAALDRLQARRDEHLRVYGCAVSRREHDGELRADGVHAGATGQIEELRARGDADPYRVAARISATVLDIADELMSFDPPSPRSLAAVA